MRRAKLRIANKGDENPKFFHTLASHRLRKNNIRALEVDGVELTAHHDKVAALLDYYTSLLGTTDRCTWSFDLDALYPDASARRAAPSSTFSREEIRNAFLAMNTRSSPGPDGFCPAFYRKFWNMLERDVEAMFATFCVSTLNLDRLNHAHLVLLPQKDGARTANAFWPISLQGCVVKGFTSCSLRTSLALTSRISSKAATSPITTSMSPSC